VDRPVQCTRSSPTFFQFRNDVHISGTTIRSTAEDIRQLVDVTAEVLSKGRVHHEIIREIVEDPMAQGNKGPHPDDTTTVVAASQGPFESREEIVEQFLTLHETSKCQEKVGEQLIVEKFGRGDLSDQSRGSRSHDPTAARVIVDENGVVEVRLDFVKGRRGDKSDRGRPIGGCGFDDTLGAILGQ
jgi:hypothetical protein